MSRYNDWTDRWFITSPGPGPDDPPVDYKFALLADWIDEDWRPPDKDRIIGYLRDTPVGLVCGSGSGPCPLCGELLDMSAQKSDGTWSWFAKLDHEVEKHQLRLPDAMVAHIRARNYIVRNYILG